MNWYFASGDAPFYFRSQLELLSIYPDAWIDRFGFGMNGITRLWIEFPFLLISGLLAKAGFSWFFIDKMWWFGALLIGITGGYKVGKILFRRYDLAILTSFFYIFNTYTLMIFSGGQLGVFLAIAFIPWVIYYSYLSLTRSTLKNSLLYTVLLSGAVASDLRIGYLLFPILLAMFIILLADRKVKFHWSFLIIPVGFSLLHLYWLLPLFLFPVHTPDILSETFTSESQLSFFSFADFSHSFSLLHPNWPENIFGKVSFYRAEFLLIPLLAYYFLLQKKIRKVFIYSGLLILLGSVLSKGTQEPMPCVYEKLFQYVPGFVMFRDPTKWYIYSVLGYAILLTNTFSLVKTRYRNLFLSIFILLLYWPIFAGNVKGNIQPLVLSNESQQLTEYIRNIPSQRILWLPTKDAFTYETDIHPSLIASDLFLESSASGIVRLLSSKENIILIKQSGVGMIIVPPDYQQKIFLEDYKYNSSLRTTLINFLDELDSLIKLEQFKEYSVYQFNNYLPMFSTANTFIESDIIGREKYLIIIPEREKEVFVNRSYDRYWRLTINNTNIIPIKTDNGRMKFILSEHSGNAVLEFIPQKKAELGAIISIITFVSIVLIICFRSIINVKKL